VVRALASHQCGLGFILARCYMWVGFVVGSRLAPGVFLQALWPSSLHVTKTVTNTLTRIVDPVENQLRLTSLNTVIYLFIYIIYERVFRNKNGFLLCRFTDIMVCTGCCGTLDFIVTHLFKTLSKRRKKNPNGMEAQPPCLRILESHPEMIQQVSACTI